MLKIAVSIVAVVLAAGVAACDRHPAPAEGVDNGRAQTGTADPGTLANDTRNTGTTRSGNEATGAPPTTGGTSSGSPGRGGAGGIGGVGGTAVAPVGNEPR
jgi:hypothetical protein